MLSQIANSWYFQYNNAYCHSISSVIKECLFWRIIQMKPSFRSILLGLMSFAPFMATQGAQAANSTSVMPTSNHQKNYVSAGDVDPELLAKYQSAILNEYNLSSDIIGLSYHEESQTVDLSTFNGYVVTVPAGAMHPVPNGE
jgi:hypothetical protein